MILLNRLKTSQKIHVYINIYIYIYIYIYRYSKEWQAIASVHLSTCLKSF